MSPSSLQEQYSPGGVCFGCGPANLQGLRMQSYAEQDAVVATWQPAGHHAAFPGVLNGGIIGTLLDCHANWTAASHLMRLHQLERPSCTVTAEYSVKLHRPTPVAGPVHLSARVVDYSTDRATVEATMSADGILRATCRGVFVTVKPGHPAYHAW